MQKIETVVKTYMACSGLKIQSESIQNSDFKTRHSETRVALDLAMDFMQQIKEIKYSDADNQIKSLVIKIGIHYGRVIAGVFF